MDDLWPDFQSLDKPIPPANLLREQGLVLGKKTGNLVYGSVSQRETNKSDTFIYRFFLKAPALSGYSYEIFYIKNPLELYPLTVYLEEGLQKELSPTAAPSRIHRAKNSDEFVELLKIIFSSERVKALVMALYSQAAGVASEEVDDSDELEFVGRALD